MRASSEAPDKEAHAIRIIRRKIAIARETERYWTKVLEIMESKNG